jgi:broad specificity phosphatase PhoE
VPNTIVYLVRHGHVENPDRVLYGRLPGFNLSALGRAQAELLGQHFARVPLAAVLASPLERAQQTAAAIAASHQLPVETEQRLTEASSLFEGVAGNLAWYILRRPGMWWKLRDTSTPAWGERNVDMAERVQAAVTAARERFPGQRVVLVSHQAPIWVARLAYERKPLGHWPGRRRCSLASVTTLEFDGDQVRRVRYAEPAALGLAAESSRRSRSSP